MYNRNSDVFYLIYTTVRMTILPRRDLRPLCIFVQCPALAVF